MRLDIISIYELSFLKSFNDLKNAINQFEMKFSGYLGGYSALPGGMCEAYRGILLTSIKT